MTIEPPATRVSIWLKRLWICGISFEYKIWHCYVWACMTCIFCCFPFQHRHDGENVTVVSDSAKMLYASQMTPSTPDQFVTNVDPSLLGTSPGSVFMYEPDNSEMNKATSSPLGGRLGYADVTLGSPQVHHAHGGKLFAHAFAAC